MSDLLDFQHKEQAEMPGQRSALSDDDLPAEQGAYAARNVELFDGRVMSRRGFTDAFTSTISGGSRVRSMYNWLMAGWNRLLMFIPHATAPSVRYKALDQGWEDNVVSSLASTIKSAVFAGYGARLIMAFLNDAGGSPARGKIWNGLFTGGSGTGPIVDDLFLAPPTYTSQFTASYSEPSSGVIDAGVHKIGLLFTTRNGFTTKAIELPNAFTATGGANLQIQLSPVGTWSASWFKVEALISTVQNPERFWIVPGVQASGFGGSGSAVLLTVDIDDTTLAALNSEISEATRFFDTYVYGDNAFNLDPKNLVIYSKRVAYVVDEYDAPALSDTSRLLITDKNDPQRLNLVDSEVRLPGNLTITGGFVQQNVLYILGPSWIYAVVDNDDAPSTWSQPHQIDGRVGTPCPFGFSNDPSRNLTWIAHPDGLYCFDGASIPDKPASYYQSDIWDRINWSAPKHALKVVVDGTYSRVLVAAPLDDATEPSAILAWNYRNGHSYQRVDFYTLDFNYETLDAIGAMAVVHYNSIPELWLANGAVANEVQRQKSLVAGDENLFRDGAAGGFSATYETGYLPRVEAQPLNVHAIHMNVRGSGTLHLTAKAKGGRTKALSDVTLESDPKGMVLRRPSMKANGVRLELSNNGATDAWFELSYLKTYFKKAWSYQR